VGVYLRVAPGLKLRATKRGIRAGIGPRAARVWVGAGGPGVSTGAGPFTLYQGLGGRTRGRSSKTSMAAYERQVRQAQQARQIQAAAATLRSMVSIHEQEFAAATRPVAPAPPPVDAKAILKQCRRGALASIPWWRLRDRRDAKTRAILRAAQEQQRQEWQLQQEHAGHQRHLDDEWALLLGNDPSVVLNTLDEAFADNEAPAVAVDCEGDHVTVVMVMEGEEALPERKPAVTPSGKPTMHRLTKTERADLYRGWLCSNLLAAVRETLALAPGIQAVTVVVLRKEPPTPYGEYPLAPIYVGTLTRARCSKIAWATPSALDAAFDADDLLVRTRGQTKSLAPIDLSKRPDLAALVQHFEATMQGTSPGQSDSGGPPPQQESAPAGLVPASLSGRLDSSETPPARPDIPESNTSALLSQPGIAATPDEEEIPPPRAGGPPGRPRSGRRRATGWAVAIGVGVLILLLVAAALANPKKTPSLSGPSPASPSLTPGTTSPSPPSARIPKVTGRKVGVAKRLLDKSGLSLVVTKQYEFSLKPPGTVLRQSPAAHAFLTDGDTVLLVLAKPIPRVPNVIGETVAAARKVLRQHNYKIKIVERASSQPTGTVIAESPAGGTRVKPQGLITLVVAKAQPQPPVNCTPGYSPCLPLGPSDYDCYGGSGNGPAYTKPGVTYQVTGSDPYDLDSNGNGLGCE
jgi:hypothetical protein